MTKIIQISDTHLKAHNAASQECWRSVVAYVRRARPQLVIHTGDIVRDDPQSRVDHEFARQALDELGVEWLAVPGNHDVGDGPPNTIEITSSLVAEFRHHYGQDSWIRRLDNFSLLGVNSMLFGTGLAEEVEQWEGLERALIAERERPVALFLHKPPFIIDPHEEVTTSASIPSGSRKQFWQIAGITKPRLIACGHRHEYRVLQHHETTMVWAPTTSHLLQVRTPPIEDSQPFPGLIEYHIEQDTILHRVVALSAAPP